MTILTEEEIGLLKKVTEKMEKQQAADVAEEAERQRQYELESIRDNLACMGIITVVGTWYDDQIPRNDEVRYFDDEEKKND